MGEATGFDPEALASASYVADWAGEFAEALSSLTDGAFCEAVGEVLGRRLQGYQEELTEGLLRPIGHTPVLPGQFFD